MLVTVLMAVRNGLPYVSEAVESVLSQTFRDFELVIMEDASTDGTRERLLAFTDPRIRLVCNESHRGQTTSLNQGLGLAKGRYVARMDADDVCLPERLEVQIQLLEQHPEIALAASRMIGITASGKRLGVRGIALSDQGSLLGRLLRGDCPLFHPTVMFRREAVEQVGGYDETFQIGQDYDLWARLAAAGFRAAVLPNPLVMYRFHPDQQSVADRPEHSGELRQAHQRLLSRFCLDDRAPGRLALLLRRDDRFWKECGSKETVAGCSKTLKEMINRVQTQLKLTPLEFQTMKRLVEEPVGWGIRLAPAIVRLPAWLFYGIVGLCSPLLIPRFHQAASSVAGWVRRGQMMLAGIKP